jgi:hypothetical protein
MNMILSRIGILVAAVLVASLSVTSAVGPAVQTSVLA